ncbi:type IV pilus modification PilV family protein [Candidatus Nitrospira bockiana]
MVAMVLVAFSILGVTGMFQWADRGLQDGGHGGRAIAMAEARVEAKRSVAWESVLHDDLDLDGAWDIEMRDDGQNGDVAGDGIYSASVDRDAVHLEWTVQPIPTGPLPAAAVVIITARATYQIGGRPRAVTVGTVRTNPNYIGSGVGR